MAIRRMRLSWRALEFADDQEVLDKIAEIKMNRKKDLVLM